MRFCESDDLRSITLEAFGYLMERAPGRPANSRKWDADDEEVIRSAVFPCGEPAT